MLFGGHVKELSDLDFLRNHGFDFGEIVFRDSENRQIWRASGIHNSFSDGFFVVAHGPREGPPNDVKHLWEHCRPALLETVDSASHMGIKLLTVHLWMDRRFVTSDSRAEKILVLNDLVSYAGPKEVVICIENLSESASDLETVLAAVPELKITLDVGHGTLLTETNTAYQIIERLSRSISHLHFHDNRGGTGVKDDLHLAIGAGIIDFPSILEALSRKGYDRTMTLEVDQEDLTDSRTKIQAMLRNLPVNDNNREL